MGHPLCRLPTDPHTFAPDASAATTSVSPLSPFTAATATAATAATANAVDSSVVVDHRVAPVRPNAESVSDHAVGVCFAAAGAQHVPALRALVFEHGVNEWNWLPPDGVTQHLDDIAQGRAHGVLALEHGQLIGAVTYCLNTDFDRYLTPPRTGVPCGYVCEAVVHRDRTGQGLGTRLLRHAVAALAQHGVDAVFIIRHEENRASAGMMRKAGFVDVDTFPDPARRPHGSGRTTVCCRQLDHTDICDEGCVPPCAAPFWGPMFYHRHADAPHVSVRALGMCRGVSLALTWAGVRADNVCFSIVIARVALVWCMVCFCSPPSR